MMRKYLLAVILFVVLSLSAQENISSWTIVPHIGLNSSHVSNKTDVMNWRIGSPSLYDSSRKSGLTVGFETDYRYHRFLSTSVGLFYSDEGYKYKEGLADTYSLRYLYLNAMENFYVVQGLSVKAGLQAGYLVGSPQFGGEPKKWNVSLPVGISYELWHVILDFRYNIGLTDVGAYKYDTNEPCHSNSFWLTLGYRIPIRRW